MWIEYLEAERSFRTARAAQPRRRALFGLELKIEIKLPNVAWSLPLGSRSIGAEFGLKFWANAVLYFSCVDPDPCPTCCPLLLVH